MSLLTFNNQENDHLTRRKILYALLTSLEAAGIPIEGLSPADVAAAASAGFPVTSSKGYTANALAPVTGNGLALAANTARKEFILQNTGTNAVYVGYGSQPDATNYHLILAPGYEAEDGRGGGLVETTWGGAVYLFSVSGTHSVGVVEVT